MWHITPWFWYVVQPSSEIWSWHLTLYVQVDSKSYNSFPTHGNTKTYRHHMRDMKIRKYYDLKHVAQMRVAITNVMEATLESAFQLILQLYIVGTRYEEWYKVMELG